MKQLYSAQNAFEAHSLRDFLAGHDIGAAVTGDNNAFEIGVSVTPQSAPCVFVSEADLERAKSLLAQFSNRPDSRESHPSWNCPTCQQLIDSQFDTCWKCGASRVDAAPSEPDFVGSVASLIHEDESTYVEKFPSDVLDIPLSRSPRRSSMLWLEMLVVCALTMPFYGGHSLATWALYAFGLHSNASNFYLFYIIRDAFIILVVLTAIRSSGEYWSAFGLKKLASADWVTACIVCFVALGLTMMGSDIFLHILKSMYGDRYVYQLTHANRALLNVQGWTGVFTFLVLSLAIGFVEELLMRGYLLTRLERLLHSSWWAVLVSSAIFAFVHWPRGPLTVFDAFLTGFVYAISFVWTRTLWPIVIAHAAYDFSAFLYHASLF